MKSRDEGGVVFALVMAVAAAAIALAAAALAGGCAKNEGRERPGTAVDSLKDTRSGIAGGQKQVDEVLAAAGELRWGHGNLTRAFEKYKKEIVETEEAAKDTRNRADDMRARFTEHHTEEQMSKVTDPDLEAASQARAAVGRGRSDRIAAKAQDARSAYQQFIRDLKDVQTYLSSDLTPPAVEAATPGFDKLHASGQELRQKLDALQKELDGVAAEMSPVAAPARRPAASR
jgi:chromosome segregation ATPase